ncbi:histidine kinase famiy protein [Roseomonas marmotae]|uniref:histidine kinase n=1 Tax=Roseomonas marmotae TaxID=2768161 RepID=A0ABS3K954_9PROT|nr:histidine kinase famiy protein [Roseomonas marmotae]MBO1073990.1 PAS domain-containing protein [Roseomonas marmotae]QTI78781.1 PAS domain-containing protein [Roseomonas marmotae]
MNVDKDDAGGAAWDADLPEQDGQGGRKPVAGPHEAMSFSATGGPGLLQWHEARVTEPGLKHRDDVFFAAVEMTRMPMILTDPNLPDNPVVFANRAFEDLTGYRQEEIVGRNSRFLQGVQTDREKVAELREAIAEKRPISAELLNYRKDGTPFWNGLFIAPVYDKAGRLLYFFASQLDVTRRRTAEQAFRQAQKMESIGQLTAGLAHDFNNLLQVIAGSLELLRIRLGPHADERMAHYIERAGEATERGSKLTRQLLAFARKTRLEPRLADINSLIHEFSEMLESSAGNQVDLQINLRRRLPSILVDAAHLEMALLNVLINARDAMPCGGTITISTGTTLLEDSELPGGSYVVLSVTDEGEGMEPYVRERATEPFFTTKGTGRGTGLGLAMVQGFVQQSLGQLEIESQPGRGTTVRMLFPAVQEAAGIAAPARPAAPERREEPRGGQECILLVEDSEDVLALACEHLEGLGYRVLTAASADEALQVLEKRGWKGIDLLFSDILMPGSMNGLGLAEKVRQRLPGMPVLLTTGYNDELVAQGPSVSSWDVVGKPYRRAALAERVRAALDRRPREGVQAPRYEVQGPRHEG